MKRRETGDNTTPNAGEKKKRRKNASETPKHYPLSERQQLALLKRMASAENSPERSSPPPMMRKTPGSSRKDKINKRNERGETALHLSTIRGDMDTLVQLIRSGADVNAQDFAGWTPLHEACNHGYEDIAKYLLEAGANVNSRGLENDTPLHDAVTSANHIVVELLLKHGANPLLANSHGERPIDVAEDESIKKLLENEIIVSDDSDSTVSSTGRLPKPPQQYDRGVEDVKKESHSTLSSESNDANEDVVVNIKSAKEHSSKRLSFSSSESDDEADINSKFNKKEFLKNETTTISHTIKNKKSNVSLSTKKTNKSNIFQKTKNGNSMYLYSGSGNISSSDSEQKINIPVPLKSVDKLKTLHQKSKCTEPVKNIFSSSAAKTNNSDSSDEEINLTKVKSSVRKRRLSSQLQNRRKNRRTISGSSTCSNDTIVNKCELTQMKPHADDSIYDFSPSADDFSNDVDDIHLKQSQSTMISSVHKNTSIFSKHSNHTFKTDTSNINFFESVNSLKEVKKKKAHENEANQQDFQGHSIQTSVLSNPNEFSNSVTNSNNSLSKTSIVSISATIHSTKHITKSADENQSTMAKFNKTSSKLTNDIITDNSSINEEKDIISSIKPRTPCTLTDLNTGRLDLSGKETPRIKKRKNKTKPESRNIFSSVGKGVESDNETKNIRETSKLELTKSKDEVKRKHSKEKIFLDNETPTKCTLTGSVESSAVKPKDSTKSASKKSESFVLKGTPTKSVKKEKDAKKPQLLKDHSLFQDMDKVSRDKEREKKEKSKLKRKKLAQQQKLKPKVKLGKDANNNNHDNKTPKKQVEVKLLEDVAWLGTSAVDKKPPTKRQRSLVKEGSQKSQSVVATTCTNKVPLSSSDEVISVTTTVSEEKAYDLNIFKPPVLSSTVNVSPNPMLPSHSSNSWLLQDPLKNQKEKTKDFNLVDTPMPTYCFSTQNPMLSLTQPSEVLLGSMSAVEKMSQPTYIQQVPYTYSAVSSGHTALSSSYSNVFSSTYSTSIPAPVKNMSYVAVSVGKQSLIDMATSQSSLPVLSSVIPTNSDRSEITGTPISTQSSETVADKDKNNTPVVVTNFAESDYSVKGTDSFTIKENVDIVPNVLEVSESEIENVHDMDEEEVVTPKFQPLNEKELEQKLKHEKEELERKKEIKEYIKKHIENLKVLSNREKVYKLPAFIPRHKIMTKPKPKNPCKDKMNVFEEWKVIQEEVVERRKKLAAPVIPQAPESYWEYLSLTGGYLLNGSRESWLSVPVLSEPSALNEDMRNLYLEHENERSRLRIQHATQREKLIVSHEQEIMRVHSRAARTVQNQQIPLSACSVLLDRETYCIEQRKKKNKMESDGYSSSSRTASVRDRFNARMFISWLQDVDDKFVKMKDTLLSRQRHEATALHAVQRTEWALKLSEIETQNGQQNWTSPNEVTEIEVPIVNISDDFDLLPT